MERSSYSPKWHKIRKVILERDGHACRICCSWENLHVHHIDYERSNNDEINLVTLCEGCHRALHAEGYKPCDHEDYPVPWKRTSPEYMYNQEYGSEDCGSSPREATKGIT